MSPHIDVDPDIFEYLKANAEPFVDTPNTVLRRLLKIDAPEVVSALGDSEASTPPSQRKPRAGKPTKQRKPAKPKRTRAAAGTLLPEAQYEMPLLRALVDAGGQASYRDVVDGVGRAIKDQLMPADLDTLSSGAIRWQSRLQFVRLRLIERGYLDKNSPRGVWGITDAGRAALETGEGS